MVDPVTLRRFLFRMQFVAVCGVLLFYKMLPLSTEPGRIPGPDLLFIFTAAVLMRRPNFAPVVLIVMVHLVADFLFMRPPGLWAAVTLVAYEFLRNRRLRDSEVPVPAEIVLVIGVFVACVVTYTVLLALFAVPYPDIATLAIHILTTAVCYPFAILVVHYILRVRRLKPGELDDDGALA